MPADLNDWAAAISFGIAGYAVLSVPYFLLVDADPADFDPRPALRRAIESGRYDAALIAVTNARRAARDMADRARRTPRDTAITAAALLALTIPTGEHR
ncbi:MAG: hypothetical protein HOV68_15060 [Streptomycetaceae bacterium]|nr:hypothetical protein [Streptomycetaceae bacterium]